MARVADTFIQKDVDLRQLNVLLKTTLLPLHCSLLGKYIKENNNIITQYLPVMCMASCVISESLYFPEMFFINIL